MDLTVSLGQGSQAKKLDVRNLNFLFDNFLIAVWGVQGGPGLEGQVYVVDQCRCGLANRGLAKSGWEGRGVRR